MMFTKDIGIDLGTANTSVCVKGKGIVMREPSVVAYDVRTDEVKAVGKAAKNMIGRTPGSIIAVRPLKNGVIADFDVTSAMLKRFIKDCQKGSVFNRVRAIITVPSGVTEVESRAVFDAAKQAGATEVDLMPVPVAAALGAGLEISDPSGFLLVDIGGGNTEVAILSLGDVVTSETIRMAGDQMDEAIMNHVRRKHRLAIGERSAEDLKIEIGSALPYEGEEKREVRGRNVDDGLPATVTVSAGEIREAILPVLEKIAESVKNILENTPPELASDILDNGITVTGGGANLRGLEEFLRNETGLNVTVASEPEDCVVRGTMKRLEAESGFDTYIFRRNRNQR